jgi:hypothetical protein
MYDHEPDERLDFEMKQILRQWLWTAYDAVLDNNATGITAAPRSRRPITYR